ncbi:MAG: ATP-binding cassette domain-containing protein [Chitinophagaceae bacterium]
MKISLTNAGKRFHRNWIFRKLSYQFVSGHSYALTGPNGSGKSTLLQVIAGVLLLSEGDLRYEDPLQQEQFLLNRNQVTEEVHPFIALSAPYLELIEEYSAFEFLQFHQHFKPFLPDLSIDAILAIVQLTDAAHRPLRHFSSGMKQRIKLAQAIFSQVPVVLLDEPCTNLDKAGIALYHKLVRDYTRDRLVIISSNDPVEYEHCEEELRMADFA